MKVSKNLLIIHGLVLTLASFISGVVISSSVPTWIICILCAMTIALMSGHISYLLRAYHTIPDEDIDTESIEEHKKFLKDTYNI